MHSLMTSVDHERRLTIHSQQSPPLKDGEGIEEEEKKAIVSLCQLTRTVKKNNDKDG